MCIRDRYEEEENGKGGGEGGREGREAMDLREGVRLVTVVPKRGTQRDRAVERREKPKYVAEKVRETTGE